MAAGTAAILGGAALAGIAGAMGDHSEQKQSSGINLAPASEIENQGSDWLLKGSRSLADLYQGAPGGASDLKNSYDSQKSLAAMLENYQNGKSGPTDADLSQGNDLARRLFAGQQTSLNQSFTDQTNAANQQAALMGRSINDPILQAKLRTQQMRLQDVLAANQGGFAAQYAMEQPGQRLGFAQARAGVLGGLASQALANKQALASLGESLQTNERNWRLQTASHWGNQSQDSGGGLGGFLKGALAGAGAGASIASGFNTGSGAGSPMMGAASQPFSVFGRGASPMGGMQLAQPMPSYFGAYRPGY